MRNYINTILKGTLYLLVIVFLAGSATSCRKKDYPCPGLGQSSEADLSMFDESGQLKNDKNKNRRINKSTGLVNKKSPKKLKAPRKTRL